MEIRALSPALGESDVSTVPSLMLLDRKGRFVYIREGFDKEQIIKAIEGNWEGLDGLLRLR